MEEEIKSRLIKGSQRLDLKSSREIRTQLKSRNIYVPGNDYPSDDGLINKKTVESINSIIGLIAPFKSYDLTNTVYGRLVTNKTPLTVIGLEMLGKMFALNFASRTAAKYLPSFKPINLLKRGESVFNFKINNKITKETQPTSFESYLADLANYYPGTNNPFLERSTIYDYLENTGKGQLQLHFNLVNKNKYKYSSDKYVNISRDVGNEYALRKQLDFISNKIFFDFGNEKFNPYLNLSSAEILDEFANVEMIRLYESIQSRTQEYAPNNDYIADNFGVINKNLEREWTDGENDWVERRKDIGNQIVWGRDGVNQRANSRLASLRGVDNVIPQNLSSKFNVKTGLLAYTSNLLNATEGQLVDQTRKVFKRGNKLVGFQGSGLWKAPDNAPSNVAGQKGIRQHTVLDPYDRFAKAIRFDGNRIYGGNKDSVIYDSVLPKIHPYPGDTANDRKKLMFSLENLAVRVISSEDGVGIIDDGQGSQIPASEVGPFQGRQMWFPPYNIEFNEVSIANWDKTEMVGRNEPIYTYMHSERTGTINFTMIIDYPPHVKNYESEANRDKELSEFFAFGGDSIELLKSIVDDKARIPDLEEDIDEIVGPVEIEPPNLSDFNLTISFPNDYPKVGQEKNVFNLMFEMGYETGKGKTTTDSTNFGINTDIYNFVEGEDQYNSLGERTIIDKLLLSYFSDEQNLDYYDIIIDATASKLYTPTQDDKIREEYNKQLGERRIEATKHLIERRIKALFGNNPQVKIITRESIGDEESKVRSYEEHLQYISSAVTKNERSSKIKFVFNGTVKTKEPELTEEEEQRVEDLKREIEDIEKNVKEKELRINNIYGSKSVFNEKTRDGGILDGFDSMSKKYYQPAFHSQTPEDFHRRLTFLQQCTRQGAARRQSGEEEDGIVRARNSVFGRQPICILRIGDFYYTKIVIHNITYDYIDTHWDMNPEGFGMQPMMVNITMQISMIGGQSLKGPIDALQNAVSFNYYANSNFTSDGMYSKPAKAADEQQSYIEGILAEEKVDLKEKYGKIRKQNEKEE